MNDIFEVIRSGKVLILDTETTGLTSVSEIVSIAVIAADGRPLLNTLVHPTRAIPPEATRIHGITNEMVRSALPFPVELLKELLTDRDVIVYNAGYDVTMLYRSTEWAGYPIVQWSKIARWYCAMETFSEIYGEWNEYRQNYKWQKLATACSYYKVDVVDAHTALSDCQMTLQVCKAMAAK
jgi:DNA polymerase III epsilon subunit-like protein